MGLKVILGCGTVHCGADRDVLTAGGISPRKAAARTGGAQERIANKSVLSQMPYLQFGCLTTFLMWIKKNK